MNGNEKDNLNLIPQDNEPEKDAQPVSETELSAIKEVMEYSGDIQPLNDLEDAEYVELDYTDAPNENQHDKNKEKNRDIIKKKKTARFGGFNKIKKKIITAVAVIIAVAGISVGGYFLSEKINVNESPVEVIFETEGQTVLRLENGKEFTMGNVSNVAVSEDGMKLYYSVDTASKTGKYDIKMIDIAKRNSLKKAGSYIDSGVNDGWQINSDGSFMTYSKTQEGSTEYYLYSGEQRQSQEITNNLEEIFLPPKGDIVYFTRRSGSIYSLHRLRFGENAANVQSGISYAQKCSSKDGMSVLYTVDSADSSKADVYVVSGDAEPTLVCKNVDEFYPQNYTYAGNLYYFTKNQSAVDWHDFITDAYYDSDANMTKPVESDYTKEIGFFFKRNVLDTTAYNAAKKKYNNKLLRDEIRAELDRIDIGLSTKEEYTCFAFNSTGSHKLATGVTLENIVACADTGAPRLIYRKAVIDVDNKINMDKLVEIASSADASEAVDYVKSKIKGAYTVSEDCIYSWYDGSRSLEYIIEGYDSKTKFEFGSRSVLFAINGGKLYYNEITASDVGEKVSIAQGVTEYSVYDGSVYFVKDENSMSSLYYYNPTAGSIKIADGVYSHFTDDESYAVVLTNSDTDGETMTVGVFRDKKYEQIDTDVNLNGFVCSGQNFTYTKSDNSSVDNEGNAMYLYSPEKGSEKINDNVTRIIGVGK